jgi:hypothetical protein
VRCVAWSGRLCVGEAAKKMCRVNSVPLDQLF